MLEQQPSPEVKTLVSGLAGLIPTAMLARFLWHHRLVRLGQRRFWSRDLLWECPTAAFSAVLGGGVAAHFALGLMEAHAVVGICAWLGPRGLEVALSRFVARCTPPDKD
ncbi:MAG: phage holin family protein [Phaeospirillum sp.]|nr:phage holin family protein [Phaeospirillum sp.]